MSRFLPFNLKDEVWAGRAKTILPTTDTGYKSYGTGRLLLPAATNLCTDPQGTLADGTFWPADTANTDTTANVAVPVAVPDNPLITKCLKLVNNGTADAPVTANITVVASTSYNDSIYVYAPTLGGNLTITSEDGHTFSLAALTAANTGFVRYSVQANTVAGEVVKGLKFTFAGGTASTVYVTGYNPIAATLLTLYFDGGYPNCVWTGAANASTSTRTVSVLSHSAQAGVGFGLTVPASSTYVVRICPLWASSGTVPNSAPRIIDHAACNILFAAVNTVRVNVGAVSATTAALTFAAGATLAVIGRWQAAGMDINVNGTAATGDAPTTGGAITAGYVGDSASAVRNANAYIGPVAICPSRITDAQTVTLSAMLTAGATGLDLFRFLRDRGYQNSLVIPLQGDSVAYRVVG